MDHQMLNSNQHVEKAAKKANSFLADVKISEVLAHKRKTTFHPLVSFEAKTTIRVFLKALNNANILSAPVYTVDEQSGDNIYVGILSVYDVLSFAVFEEIFDSDKDFQESNLFDYIERMDAKEFFNTPIEKALGSSAESLAPWMFYSTDSVSDLVSALTTSKQHRVLVVDSDILMESVFGPIPPTASITLLSQTDVVSFLVNSNILPKEILEPILDIQVGTVSVLLGQNKAPIIAILENQTTLHGLKTMYMDNLQAVPVINKNGELVANLSASDLRGLNLNNMSKLNKPVFEYLESERRNKEGLMADQISQVKYDVPLEHAIKEMQSKKTHRVWVTGDGLDALSGVLTYTDVLNMFKELPIH
ncbi:hypothetical protein HDV06_005235 [Boothiomyces sp. JEL0866]|nr:hypothetical protein HDV06_005235 [Boothiomyces sp. JEL0866]